MRLGRVGVIAILGFLLGVAWPRLAGIKLAPLAPEAERSGEGPRPTKAEAPAEREGLALPELSLEVGPAKVTSCRNAQGRAQSACDTPDFDSVVRPRLETLRSCEAAQGAIGSLSLGMEVDFAKGRIERLLLGKSTTLPLPTARAILACVEGEFETASLAGLGREQAAYSVFFAINFAQTALPEAAGDEVVAASGRATVGWQVALIREQPGNDAPVLARLRSGTRVVVVARKADWYRVKFDAKGSEGWVYRAAIGL